MGDYDLSTIAPDECCEEVSRRGEAQSCDKTAVAVRIDPTFGDMYPVCAFHARGEMVPLRDLLAAATPMEEN